MALEEKLVRSYTSNDVVITYDGVHVFDPRLGDTGREVGGGGGREQLFGMRLHEYGTQSGDQPLKLTRWELRIIGANPPKAPQAISESQFYRYLSFEADLLFNDPKAADQLTFGLGDFAREEAEALRSPPPLLSSKRRIDATLQSDYNEVVAKNAKAAYETAVVEAVEQIAEEDPEKIRLAQQCVLLSVADKLADLNRPLGYNGKMIHVDGEPDYIANYLLKRPGEREFTNICPEQLAELTPYVRIHKVKINSTNNTEKHIEFAFENALSSKDLFTSVYDRGTGAGLKSIDWTYDGSDPFTANRSIQVNMSFFFQSLDELFKKRYDRDEEYRYVDLILQADCRKDLSQDTERKPSERDLEPTSYYQEEFYPECYQIKLDLGWSDPGPSSVNTLSPESYQSTRTSLFLTLKDHDLTIQQDGTVSLTANYNGLLAGLTSDPRANVFIDPADANVMEKIKQLKGFIKNSKCNERVFSRAKEELSITLQNQKQSLLSSIVKELDRNNYLTTIEVETSDYIRYIRALKEGSLLNLQTVKDLSFNVFKAQGVSEAEAFFQIYEDSKATTADLQEDMSQQDETNALLDMAGPGVIQSGLRYLNNRWAKETAAKYENASQPLRNYITGETAEDFYKDHVEFTYFYLGDLIDIITRRVLNKTTWNASGASGWRGQEYDTSVEKIRIVMGTIELRFARTNKIKRINLSDIPISFALFLDWMKDNVIDSQREEYPFVRFINDIMNSLVSAALGSNCFNNNLSQRVKLKKTFFSSAEKDGIEPFQATGGGIEVDSDALDCLLRLEEGQDGSETQLRERLNTYESDEKYKELFDPDSDMANFYYGSDGVLRGNRIVHPVNKSTGQLVQGIKKDAGHFHYILFYMDNATTRDKKKGIRFEDEQNGIYHFLLGRDCGILKSINFKKSNVQFFKEARISQQISDNPLAQLSNVYDVELKMVGNNIFIPGRQIFFNPASISNDIGSPSTPNSYANLLGIGGYHTVTNVSSFIRDGTFETVIDAAWTTGGGDTIPIRAPADDEVGGRQDDC